MEASKLKTTKLWGYFTSTAAFTALRDNSPYLSGSTLTEAGSTNQIEIVVIPAIGRHDPLR
jgi:hypothetical protein